MMVAGVDIGSNTILMTIAERGADGHHHVVVDRQDVARLGAGVDATGAIGAAAMERAIDVLRRYRRELADTGVTAIKAGATSAVRDARNQADVVAALGEALGHPVDVLDGIAEASYTVDGVLGADGTSGGLIDIGGGSTEVAYRSADASAPLSARSLQCGAVRCMERWRSGMEPYGTVVIALDDEIVQALRHDGPWYAVAGTPTALATLDLELPTFDASAIEGYRLDRSMVRRHTERLLTMTEHERRALPGVEPWRADILPAGAAILLGLMDRLAIETVLVSTKGLRHGLMMAAR